MPDPTNDEGEAPEALVLSLLRAELAQLRLQIEDGVRTRQLVVVDGSGIARCRITAPSGEECRLVLCDEDGFERIGLKCLPNIGVIEVAGRSHGGEPTRIDVFAHDPADGDGCQVGVHLTDRGEGVGGFDVFEGGEAHVWTDPPS